MPTALGELSAKYISVTVILKHDNVLWSKKVLGSICHLYNIIGHVTSPELSLQFDGGVQNRGEGGGVGGGEGSVCGVFVFRFMMVILNYNILNSL